MKDKLEFSTTLKFYPNLHDVIPEYNPPALERFSDKALLPASVLNDLISQQSASGLDLPSPLFFNVRSGTNSCIISVREFSSAEGYIGLPQIIQEKLKISEVTQEVAVHLVLETTIPKGSSLVLKPLDPDYSVPDWKFFLEAKLNSNYTSLTKNDILYIRDKNDVYKLLIDNVEPQGTVSVIDTDIDLSIEPLNEEHAKSMKENASKVRDIVELKEPTIIFDLGLQSVDYKFKYPVNERCEIILQAIVKDAEFDINLIDIFVSRDQFIDKHNFSLSTLNSKQTVREERIVQLTVIVDELPMDGFIYLSPYLWTSRTVFEIKVATTADKIVSKTAKTAEESSEGSDAVCQNCNAKVPQSSLLLHENFCFRNNLRCPQGCGKVFHKKIPDTHWHCKLCDTVKYGDTEQSLIVHNSIMHTQYQCDCDMTFADLPSYASHCANECPLRLHVCRFCHLVVPAGPSNWTHEFKKLSEHELGCGSKTIDCSKCGKPVKLFEYESHVKLHEMDRKLKPEPTKCHNVNCVRTKNVNELGLCDICFGPSFSNVYDPASEKLQARFERRYVIQLSKGCGFSWCKNPSCKSSGIPKFSSMGDIMKHVSDDLLVNIPLIPSSKLANSNASSFQFCVDSSMTKKKLLADWIFEEGLYSYNWCCEAVGYYTDEQAAKRWLAENGVALVES